MKGREKEEVYDMWTGREDIGVRSGDMYEEEEERRKERILEIF